MNSKEEVIKHVLEGKVRLEDLGKEEKLLFEDDSEIATLEQILRASNNWEPPQGQDVDRHWNNILTLIEQEEQPVRRLYWLPAAAAVAVLMLVSYFIWFVPSSVTVASGTGELKEVVLPDQSTVLLNANSSITYSVSYSEGWDRKLQLEGKARFVVTEGEQFDVYTGPYTTTVLGTEFDVAYSTNSFEVSCYSGKVQVADGTSSQILTGGQRARVVSGQLVALTFDPEASIRWTSGEFYFDGVPFEEVVLELERQFDLEIRGLEPDTRSYQGYFFKDNLEEALQLVFQPMGYEYELNGRVLMIK